MSHCIAYRSTLNALRQVVVAACLTVLFSAPAWAQASQVPNAKQQFIDPTGAAYDTGQVFMYVPNTFTKKSTWIGPDQATQNVNPIVLDSAGRAKIWGVGSYRQVLKDKNGLQIWDELTIAPAPSVTTIATSGAGDFLPIGAILPIAGYSAPVNYVFANGQALSRTTYLDAFTAFTVSSEAACLTGNATITGIASTAQIKTGAPIEASCLSPGTTVATIAGPTSITVTPVAAASGATTVRVFNWGSGDGVTTFNVPDLRGNVMPGTEGMGVGSSGRLTTAFYGSNPNVPSARGGVQSRAIDVSNLPPYTPTGTIGNVTAAGTVSAPTITLSAAATNVVNNGAGGSANLTGGGGALLQATITGSASAPMFTGTPVSGGVFTGGAQGGSSQLFPIVQPSVTVNYAVKVLNGTLPVIGVLSLGGMGGDIACGSNLTCALQTISLNTALNFSGTTVSGGTFSTSVLNGPAIGTGTLTNVPNPVAATDAANKQYVDAVAQGLLIQTPVVLATAAVLPNTPTYSNGALGVGATLTAGANAALVIDATAAALNNRVLVKNQASQFQNGCFTVTTVGTVSVPWVLTRCTDFDTAAEMLGRSYFLVTSGPTNGGSSYVLQNTVTTVGTTAAVFVQFGSSSVSSIGGASGAIGLGSNLSIPGGVLTVNVRPRLLAGVTYYVRTDGDNANCTGLTDAAYVSGSFPQNCSYLTWQKAFDVLATLDFNSQQVILQHGTEIGVKTFTVGNTINALTGAGTLLVKGSSTIGNTVFNVVGADIFKMFNVGPTGVNFDQMTLQGGDLGQINVLYQSIASIGSAVYFGTAPFAHVYIHDRLAMALMLGSSYKIIGGAGYHVFINGGWMFHESCVITLTGTPNFTGAFVEVINGGGVQLTNFFSGGGATGPRYYVDSNGVINTFGQGINIFPGSVAGVPAPPANNRGGQYIP